MLLFEKLKCGYIFIMKKLIAFVLILACVASTAFFKVEKNPLFDIDGVTKVCFVSNQDLSKYDMQAQRCGDMFFNFCDQKTAKEKVKIIKNKIQSVQFYFDKNDESVMKKLKFTLVNEKEIENIKVLEGYSPLCGAGYQIDKKNINVQIAIKGDEIVVGTPLILTGY